jgi:outer membrane lipoprotein
MVVRLLLIALLLSLGGCSSNPPMPTGDRSLTPKQVAQGSTVPEHDLQWGGIVIATRNLPEHSEVEILAYPLDGRGRPNTQAASLGRFIAQQTGYLESEEYAAGRQVTATGRFKAIRSGKVGDAEYRFPLLICDQLALWPKEAASRAKPRIRFGFGASSGGRSYGGIGIGFGF